MSFRAKRHDPSSPWGRAWGLLLGLVAGAWAPSACTLQLDDGIACGDGFVDTLAGEECDPGDPSSFESACLGTDRPDGIGACNPVTCEIENDIETCAVCGDGIADVSAGEECDGDDFLSATCIAGGAIQCNDDCTLDRSACVNCGNGVLDPWEECDPLAVEILTMGKPECSELASPNINKPYSSGVPGRCLSDCRWERAGCSYCGDGTLDEDPLAVDPEGNFQTLPEICDGVDFDSEALDSKINGSNCSLLDEMARPIVECSDDCLEIIPRTDLAQPCCLEKYAPCPSAGDTLRCCFEHENPQEPEACDYFYLPPDNFQVYGCR